MWCIVTVGLAVMFSSILDNKVGQLRSTCHIVTKLQFGLCCYAFVICSDIETFGDFELLI
jgi:hypothetical protein